VNASAPAVRGRVPPASGRRRAAVALCLAVLSLGGCHAAFRFDETGLAGDPPIYLPPPPDTASDLPPPPDAAAETVPANVPANVPDAPAERPAPPDGADCFVGLCGWEQESSCSATSCELECEDGDTCSGSCGNSCSARCREQARCSLTAGAAPDLECRERSTCAFVVGAGGQVRCREGASCTVRCLGACSLDCEDATCRLQCAADNAPRVVSGSVTCP
jgi:hypothetical protein